MMRLFKGANLVWVLAILSGFTYAGYQIPSFFQSHEELAEGGEIQFIKNDLDKAIEQAQKAQKPIMVDNFATWCGPCKWMEKHTFQADKVGKFYNSQFVNLKLDADSPQGQSFLEEHGINSVPTFVYLNPKGQEITRFSGRKNAKGFIREGKAALDRWQE